MSSTCRCARLPGARHTQPALGLTRLALRRQGVKFTDNVVADPDLTNAVQGATLLIFVLPHQVTWTPPLSLPPRPRAACLCGGACLHLLLTDALCCQPRGSSWAGSALR